MLSVPGGSSKKFGFGGQFWAQDPIMTPIVGLKIGVIFWGPKMGPNYLMGPIRPTPGAHLGPQDPGRAPIGPPRGRVWTHWAPIGPPRAHPWGPL